VAIKALSTVDNAKVVFNQCTDLLVREKFMVGKYAKVQESGLYKVVIYAGEDVLIRLGSTVNANIYTRKKLQVLGNETATTRMHGQFIAKEVNSKGRLTEWSIDETCDDCAPLVIANRSTEIAEFDAQKEDGMAKLTWAVNTEYRDKKYITWHSTDGKNFVPLMDTDVRGNSNQGRSYSQIHANPASGANFYRLQTLRKDGTSVFSDTRRLDFHFAATDNGLLVYPNPASTETFLRTEGLNGLRADLHIVNSFGKVVFTQSFDALPDAPVKLNCSRFQAGIYTVFLQTDGKRSLSKKFVVVSRD
jgi:hypothetical protein